MNLKMSFPVLLSIELRSIANKSVSDIESRVEAIGRLIAAGAKGIVIPSSESAISLPAVEKVCNAAV